MRIASSNYIYFSTFTFKNVLSRLNFPGFFLLENLAISTGYKLGKGKRENGSLAERQHLQASLRSKRLEACHAGYLFVQ